MPITIGQNIASLKAQRQLERSSEMLSRTFERLASGQRINRASDDAAGLSISSRLNSDARVFAQGIRNVNDGISMVHIASGALSELVQICQRHLELAEQAANGSYSSAQRQALNTEANALVAEYNRIVDTTKFNGLAVFDPNFDDVTLQAGYGPSSTLQLSFDGLTRSEGNGTFATSVSYLTAGGASTRSVDIADLNGDGKLDLATADVGNTKVSVFYGNGDGTFQAARTYATASLTPIHVSLGDLNNDGRADIVTSDNTNANISVLINTGGGTFATAKSYAIGGTRTDDNILGDVDGDTFLDIISVDDLGSDVSVFINNGNGTFKAATSYFVFSNPGSLPQGVSVGDVNGDSRLDVLTADYATNRISILLGNGNGTFFAAVSRSLANVGTGPRMVTPGDLNGDGVLDLVSANYGSAVAAVFIGNGNGTFKVGVSYTLGGGTQPNDIILLDFNGDAKLDFATANMAGGGVISVALGNGDGTFKASVTYTSAAGTPREIAAADLNGDGVRDIVNATLTGVSVFMGQGSPTAHIAALDLTTQANARDSLGTISTNLDRVSRMLGNLGAQESRFEVAVKFLQSAELTALQAAQRITDADIAQESAELTRNKILQSAVAAVLAQANQQPTLALTLLR